MGKKKRERKKTHVVNTFLPGKPRNQQVMAEIHGFIQTKLPGSGAETPNFFTG